ERRYIPGARTAYTFHDEEIDMAFTTGSTAEDLKTITDAGKIIGGIGGILGGIAAAAAFVGLLGGGTLS
ncbi:hypothetical protein QM646_46605, partial [Rhodococcus erythropolis]|nr:hypothetical protein [Rhodococcus erythropolis]